MLLVGVGGEDIQVALAVGGQGVTPEVAVEEAQLAHYVEVQVEDGDVAAAAHHIDIGAVGVHAGGLAQVVAHVEDHLALGVEDVDGVLLTVADPDVVLGVAAQGVDHQELARGVGVGIPDALAAPGLHILAVLIELVDSKVAVAVGDVHVALGVVGDVGGVVEGLAQLLQLMLEHPLVAAAVVAVAGLGGKDAVVHSHPGEHVDVLDVVAGLALLAPGTQHLLGLDVQLIDIAGAGVRECILLPL